MADNLDDVSDALLENGFDSVIIIGTQYNAATSTTTFTKHTKGNSFACMQSLAEAYENAFSIDNIVEEDRHGHE